eukprot:gi/632985816/ref/XP_007909894.1/ PREDICTED: vascular endothelial growth factor A-like isoform X2 [Callorhinchus milii]
MDSAGVRRYSDTVLLLVFLLWVPACQPFKLSRTTEVILFEEVWNRSYCRTIEVLVDVIKEYPSESAYIFKPSCVPLFRCAGCCGDEKLQCTAQETHNITMQIIKLKPSEHVTQQEEKTFTEHSSCECRPRRKRLKGERRNSKRRGQKRNSSKLARETAPSRLNSLQLRASATQTPAAPGPAADGAGVPASHLNTMTRLSQRHSSQHNRVHEKHCPQLH